MFNIAQHFEEYRAQVKAESLDWCVEYARQKVTKKPESYPTAYDYLNTAMNSVRQCVASGDLTAYMAALARHQEALVALFEAMVEEDLWDYRSLTTESLLTLIDERGWQWFKFCKHGIEFKLDVEGRRVDIIFVPRYAEKYRKLWSQKDKAAFDANEIASIFKGAATAKYPRKTLGDIVLALKLEKPTEKVLSVKEVEGSPPVAFHKPVDRLNREGGVDDWTLPLW